MRVTLDTNFLISATQWDYSVSNKLLIGLIGNAELFTTNEILEEFSKVLKRDFKYNPEEIANIISEVSSFLTIVKPKLKIEIIKDDPEDNKVIECALESSSKYIITYDNHLLKLDKIKDIKIIKPEEALNLINS
jgi:putative PIN family toxin of toxin-antitoxin system